MISNRLRSRGVFLRAPTLALAIAICAALTGCYTQLRLPEQRIAYEEEPHEEPGADPHAGLALPDARSIEVTVDRPTYWTRLGRCDERSRRFGLPSEKRWDCVQPVAVNVTIRNLSDATVVVEGFYDAVSIYVEEWSTGAWHPVSLIHRPWRSDLPPPALFPNVWWEQGIDVDTPGTCRVGIKALGMAGEEDTFFYSPPFEVVLQ